MEVEEGVGVGGGGTERDCCKNTSEEIVFPEESHLWDGTDADTVDEGALQDLAFLRDRSTER